MGREGSHHVTLPRLFPAVTGQEEPLPPAPVSMSSAMSSLPLGAKTNLSRSEWLLQGVYGRDEILSIGGGEFLGHVMTLCFNLEGSPIHTGSRTAVPSFILSSNA